MDRYIVHFDLDTFFVSVERLQNSKLNGKPVIIGGLSDRGVVASCSYEARKYGVHSAMPLKMARMLCRDGVFIRGDMESYSKHSKIVTEIIAEKAPVYEKASIDEHYIDITGMDRFFGSLKWTQEMRQSIIKNTGLPISFGLSANKTVSKIATGEAKPNGELEIAPKIVQQFLNPLSIRKIPMIGEKTYKKLRSMGVGTIKTLAEIPPEMLSGLMGKNGLEIWRKAHGIDNTPVFPYSEQKSMSAETTFETDTTDISYLTSVLVNRTEKLAYQLRKKSKLVSCVTVKIRYSNFDTHTLQRRIPYTAFDHELIEVVKDLFQRLYQRRMLIRLVGVRFSHLIPGTYQTSLFGNTTEMQSLYFAMDKIRNRFGKKAVRRASGIYVSQNEQ
ncbi:MAG: DNA polymerase IV [Bacteroidetes bacterium]|nr:DNA polymerase IV [Bacteroidota bacterium]